MTNKTKPEIISIIENAASDMSNFYCQSFINYRGKTDDTDELYTEVIAEWLLDHIEKLNEINSISRKSSYKVATHDGVFYNEKSNRTEEKIAKALFTQKSFPLLGEIIDYQTPLKNISSDKAGKIDLLSFDGKTLRILELKKEDSKETMLRCVLECYTYLKSLDCNKLLRDFSIPNSEKVIMKASPLVFKDKSQYDEIKSNGHPFLMKLMKILEIEPFYIEKNYKITND